MTDFYRSKRSGQKIEFNLITENAARTGFYRSRKRSGRKVEYKCSTNREKEVRGKEEGKKWAGGDFIGKVLIK